MPKARPRGATKMAPERITWQEYNRRHEAATEKLTPEYMERFGGYLSADTYLYAMRRVHEDAHEAVLEQIPEPERSEIRESRRQTLDLATTADERWLYYAHKLGIPTDRGLLKGIVNYLVGKHGMTAGEAGSLTIAAGLAILEADLRKHCPANAVQNLANMKPLARLILPVVTDTPKTGQKIADEINQKYDGNHKGTLAQLTKDGLLKTNGRCGYTRGPKYPPQSLQKSRPS